MNSRRNDFLALAGVVTAQYCGESGVGKDANRGLVVVGQLDGVQIGIPSVGRLEQARPRVRDSSIFDRDEEATTERRIRMSSHQSVDAKQFDVVSAVDGIVDQTVVAVVEFVVDSVLRSIGASRAELADVRRRPELGRRFVGARRVREVPRATDCTGRSTLWSDPEADGPVDGTPSRFQTYT